MVSAVLSIMNATHAAASAVLHGNEAALYGRAGRTREGAYLDADAALVHRRLIVIDPEGGAQPMHSPDRNTIIIYNGELYNTRGIAYRTYVARARVSSDIRTLKCCCTPILSGKPDAFSRLNGIFAFAIWEKRERRLTLCRDRLGVKPLFFAPIRNGTDLRFDHRHRAVPSGDRACTR